jgi:hypothetical protein
LQLGELVEVEYLVVEAGEYCVGIDVAVCYYVGIGCTRRFVGN